MMSSNEKANMVENPSSNQQDTTTTTGNQQNQKFKVPASAYLKSHKSITFFYANDTNTFQQGQLGDSDTFLVGTLHLNYAQPRQIRSVVLHLRGSEKTSWYKAQARSKALYTGEQVLVDEDYKLWEADDQQEVQDLDIPFKFKLPYNLPETVKTEIGSVKYVLRATVNKKGTVVSTGTQVVEVDCPLKKTLIVDSQNNSPYKLRGESRSGIDYTFYLPPNKNLNLGTYISVPMRIRFLRPGISVERVEIILKTCMDFRCNNPNETRHVKEKAAALIVPRQELRHLQPVSNQYEGECVHTINLFVPRSVQPSYSGRFISITHQLCIKFCLWGADMDFQVEESVRVANIYENPMNNDSAIPPPVPPQMGIMQPSRPESPYDYQNVYQNNAYSDVYQADLREMKLRGIDPRFLNSYGLEENLPGNHPMNLQQMQLQATQQQLQNLQIRGRRPSKPTPVELASLGYNDGYDPSKNHNNFIMNAQNVPNAHLWYRYKNDINALNQYLRPAEPKVPPLHPPPPTPPNLNIYTNAGIPGPKNSPNALPPYQHAYPNPLSPPQYRQQNPTMNTQQQTQPRQYIDSATMYAYDFDD